MSTTYINQILPFGAEATEARGDILSLEDYAKDVQRLVGHQPGIARCELANRAERQSSHMAAGLAQFIANRFAAGVLDNGDLDAVEAGLAEAVQKSVLWEGLPMMWLPTANYRIPKIVLGSDGKVYLWIKASGPDVAGVGAKDPTAAGSDVYWLDYATSITSKSDYEYSRIGVPHYFSSTVLSPDFMWADGSLALFEDYPQFAAKYQAGGFEGMVLPATATQGEKDAYLGKFVLNANGTGLYLPRHGGQFVRNWVPGQTVDAGREAGSWQADDFKSHTHTGGGNPNTVWCNSGGGSSVMHAGTSGTGLIGGPETRPDNIAGPIVIYMGNHE